MIGAVRPLPKPNEAASYIEQTTTELRDLANRAGMPFLGYLIDMARLEAASQVLSAPKAPAVVASDQGRPPL
jgi:hypothetical protein